MMEEKFMERSKKLTFEDYKEMMNYYKDDFKNFTLVVRHAEEEEKRLYYWDVLSIWINDEAGEVVIEY